MHSKKTIHGLVRSSQRGRLVTTSAVRAKGSPPHQRRLLELGRAAFFDHDGDPDSESYQDHPDTEKALAAAEAMLAIAKVAGGGVIRWEAWATADASIERYEARTAARQ